MNFLKIIVCFCLSICSLTVRADKPKEITETNPTYPFTDLPLIFRHWSEENGICILLGYRNAVPYSAKYAEQEKRAIYIDAFGHPKKRATQHWNAITEIKCMQKDSNFEPVPLYLVRSPELLVEDRLYGMMATTQSGFDTICHTQNNLQALPNSWITTTATENVAYMDPSTQDDKNFTLKNKTGFFKRAARQVSEIVCLGELAFSEDE